MNERANGFTALEAGDFIELPYAIHLKGLLRPFKDQSELRLWSCQCEQLRDSLITLAQRRVLPQATAYPLSLLRVQLAQQTTGAGTTFLRWRNVDRSAMGVVLWQQVISHPQTPAVLRPALLAIELQRIALNMQISLTHTIARQAAECATKMEQAESFYLKHSYPEHP